jgi:hypothetical protein
MTAAERREANRLRSERWRRAHGIGPRKPAQKPWLAEGCSRSTWYRRGNRIGELTKAMEREAGPGRGHTKENSPPEAESFSGKLAALKESGISTQEASAFERLSRASVFVAQLQAELVEVARCHAVAAAIIGELAAISCARSPGSIAPAR